MFKFSKLFILMSACVLALTSSTCTSEPGGSGGGGSSSKKDSWAHLVNEKSGSLEVNGNKATWGSHTYEFIDGATEKRMVFSNIPSGYTEFSALYTQFCGKNPYCTAAMMVWAIEIYARDAATGEKCIRLMNQDSNVPGVLRELKQKFTHSSYAPANDTYVQRYLAAAFMAGGKPETKYAPSEPYTITMVDNHYQDEEKAPEICIVSDAYSTKNRHTQILLPDHALNNKGLCVMFNCPSLYTQCPVFTGTWGGLK